MSDERAVFRLSDIKQAIGDIRRLLAGRTYDDAIADRPTSAAFERFLEIVSEASRGVPADWRAEYGAAVPWPNIASIGNILRHGYRNIDHAVLWNIYQEHLNPLEAAIDAMIERYGPIP